MIPPAQRGQPIRLSERLKQLDDGQYPGGIPAFDLDAAVRGGQRRRQRRTALNLAGALAVVAIASGVTLALPRGTGQQTVTPITSTPPVAPVTAVSARGREVRYHQDGDTVTARKNGVAVATIRLISAKYDQANGQLTLYVTAKPGFTFSFTRGQFIWEGEEDGEDSSPPAKSQDIVTIEPSQPQNVLIDYPQVERGTVLWATDENTVVGAWTISASGQPPTIRPLAPSSEPSRATP